MATNFHNFRTYLLSLLLGLTMVSVNGQHRSGSLTLDSKVPNAILSSIFEQPGNQINLSDLKGKLVILDFWNVHCSNCIQAMPEMNELQEYFGEKIKILLVTKDSDKEVKALFDRLNIRDKIKHLTVVTNDTVLNQLFPHEAEPHHVWIDQRGIFRYNTFADNASKINIKKMLEGEALSATQIRADFTTWDLSKQLFSQVKERYSNSVEQYSIFLRGMRAHFVSSLVRYNEDSLTKQKTGFTGTNLSPITLLQEAFNKDVYGFDIGIYNLFKNRRMIISVKDSSALHEPAILEERDSWYRQNAICYEVKVKHPDQLHTQMQSDLNNYLTIKGVIEKRETLCYVLKLAGTAQLLRATLGETPKISFRDRKISLVKQPMWMLVKQLTEYQKEIDLPFIDQTGFSGDVTVSFSVAAKYDIDLLRRELAAYGLTLEKENVGIPMLVVYDK